MTNNRGSNWHMWDLHVHTPFSIAQNYGDSADPQEWEAFIADLEKISDTIKAIGINDYNSIEGYKKVLEYKAKGRLPKIELTLPVIELRTTNLTGEFAGKTNRVNYHIIFSDKVSCDDITTKFLNALKCEVNFGDGPFSTNLTNAGLIELGQKYRSSLSNPADCTVSDLEAGFNNFQV